MSSVANIVSWVRTVTRVRDGEPAPTTRWDAPYAVIMAIVLVLALVATSAYGPSASFHRPLWELFFLGGLAFLAASLSRHSEDQNFAEDFTALFTTVAAALHGPVPAALLGISVSFVANLPERRVMGGWHQLLLCVVNTGMCAMVEGLVFAWTYAQFGSIGLAAATMVALSMGTNIMINIGWCIAGNRSLMELLRAQQNVLATIATVMYIALGVAAAIQEWFLAVCMLSPLVLSKVSEMTANQLRQAERSLMVDSLTGVYNRRYFWDQLMHRIDHVAEPWHVGVIMADIDNFKILNDTHGHIEGDTALRATAEALARALPDAIVARYGGEEFGIIVSLERGVDLAVQAEQALAAARVALEPWSTSISVGVATCATGEDAHEVTARADRALYASKHNGKDRVTVADEPPGASLAA